MPVWREAQEEDDEDGQNEALAYRVPRCGEDFGTAFTVSAVCLTALMFGMTLMV